jgi:hypothetical protein
MLQRFWRGCLGRWKASIVKYRVLLLALTSAALTIQSWARMVLRRAAFVDLLTEYRRGVHLLNAVLLQKVVRGWTRWHVYQRYKALRLLRSKHRAATRFQALARGFLCRCKYKRHLQTMADGRLVLTQNWAAVCIQRLVRGMIAR